MSSNEKMFSEVSKKLNIPENVVSFVWNNYWKGIAEAIRRCEYLEIRIPYLVGFTLSTYYVSKRVLFFKNETLNTIQNLTKHIENKLNQNANDKRISKRTSQIRSDIFSRFKEKLNVRIEQYNQRECGIDSSNSENI